MNSWVAKAEKAKQLLDLASHELKEAGEFANHHHQPTRPLQDDAQAFLLYVNTCARRGSDSIRCRV